MDTENNPKLSKQSRILEVVGSGVRWWVWGYLDYRIDMTEAKKGNKQIRKLRTNILSDKSDYRNEP